MDTNSANLLSSRSRRHFAVIDSLGFVGRQIVLQRGIPFEMKLPTKEPLAFEALTKEQFDREIAKGMNDIAAGNLYAAEDVEAEMKKEFHL